MGVRALESRWWTGALGSNGRAAKQCQQPSARAHRPWCNSLKGTCMNTPARPNRRAALRFALLALCLSAALVAILPVRAAPSAAPSQQMGGAFDVYMRDTAADNGTEPSAGSVYMSPDILVCNTRYCTSEQAPILNQDNYV